MPDNDKLATEVNTLRTELAVYKDTQKTALDAIQKQIELTKSIAALELEVKSELNKLKWLGLSVAAAATVVGVFAGIVGYHSVDDYIKTVKTEVTTRLDQISAYYYDFTKGNALLAVNDYAGAIPYLRRCYDQSPYDESVLIPFFNALDVTGDLTQGGEVIEKLRADSSKFSRLGNPFTLVNIGVIQHQIALDKSQEPDAALQSFQSALTLAAHNDYETRKAIYRNLWLLYLAKGDKLRAQQYIDSLKALPQNVTVEPWDTAKTYTVLRRMAHRDSGILKIAEQMWTQLKSRFAKA